MEDDMATRRSARQFGTGILTARLSALAPRGEHAAGPVCSFPLHRAIVAVDIEASTARSNPIKGGLRHDLYQIFKAALGEGGIHKRHRDALTDRGDGILALIHPVDEAPKTLLLNSVIPALARRLAVHNASIPVTRDPRRQLRLRAVVHAGEVHYDGNGPFGEALDVAFRLLDAAAVKILLRHMAAPLALVVSDDMFCAVVRHGYDGIDEHAFTPGVCVQIAGHEHRGWLHTTGDFPVHSGALHEPEGQPFQRRCSAV
jgi:class 3 adenylate cyclase